MYSDTTNGHKLADFHRRLDIELMRGIFENVQNVPVVGTFGSRRQSEREGRFEIRQNFLIGFSCRMMRFVNDQILKIRFAKLLRMQRDALHTAANNKRILFFERTHIDTDAHVSPQSFECLRRLCDKLVGMRDKQRALANALCVRDRSHGFSRACRVINQGDGFMPPTHFFKRSKRVFLVFLELQIIRFNGFAPLTRKIVLHLAEMRRRT